MSNSPVIELVGLSKWYGEVIGLNNVSASVGHGITGLVGPNGAGKSTTMGLATGQLKPSMGTIRVFGQRVWNKPAVLSRIGYCPEGDPFWPNLTGRQFVRFLARMSGIGRAQANAAVEKAIARTDMLDNADRAIQGYSKGMRQRIKIAQALVHDPRLLILDEPFTGTDPVARHQLRELFGELASSGVDILVSSHVLHEVEALTSRIMMIDHGRIVAQGELHAIRRGMHDRPHAIRVRTDSPRPLAVRLAALEFVTALSIPDTETLIVNTPAPEKLYDELPGLILDVGASVHEIAADDEDLEALFGFLTTRSGL